MRCTSRASRPKRLREEVKYMLEIEALPEDVVPTASVVKGA
ncbi:MAG TPA: hypothetical protein VHF89_04195 [Solirubrobacteraceae bacterium]|nr:hypothetical protein [Solirubrobacteraceae bacterium]